MIPSRALVIRGENRRRVRSRRRRVLLKLEKRKKKNNGNKNWGGDIWFSAAIICCRRGQNLFSDPRGRWLHCTSSDERGEVHDVIGQKRWETDFPKKAIPLRGEAINPPGERKRGVTHQEQKEEVLVEQVCFKGTGGFVGARGAFGVKQGGEQSKGGGVGRGRGLNL